MINNKIGILTWHYYNNFGSALQSFALQHIIIMLGYHVDIINYRNPKFGKTTKLKENLLYFANLYFYKYLPKYYQNKVLLFRKKYMYETKMLFNEDDLSKFSKTYNTIVCGSDQIWAPNVYNPIYMLDFVPDGVNKVSYAASIGLESIPNEMVINYKENIGRINHVSVREEKGKEILKNQCGIESTVVLDPTLLLPKEEWDKIKKKTTIKEEYIFCYFLKKDHQYKELVKEFAERNGYSIYGVSDNIDDSSWIHTFDFQTVNSQDFIGLIEGAQSVFTDSYHGTIFSMIYHKPFLLFERFSSHDTICQNSRIEQLRTYFGIDKNIVKAESISKIEIPQINYDEFENTLSKLREGSMSFLKQALN